MKVTGIKRGSDGSAVNSRRQEESMNISKIPHIGSYVLNRESRAVLDLSVLDLSVRVKKYYQISGYRFFIY